MKKMLILLTLLTGCNYEPPDTIYECVQWEVAPQPRMSTAKPKILCTEWVEYEEECQIGAQCPEISR